MDAHKTLRPHLMLKGWMDEVLSRRLKLKWLLKCMKLLECQVHRKEAGGEVYIASKGIEPLEKKAVRRYEGSDSPVQDVGQSGPSSASKPQLAVVADVICPRYVRSFWYFGRTVRSIHHHCSTLRRGLSGIFVR